MLTEQEIQQICRKYSITCALCSTPNEYYRLKRDMVRPAKSEGDGHPLTWRWGKSGFDSVDPKQFFLGVCQKCFYAGDLEDADFRKSGDAPDKFKDGLSAEAVQQMMTWSSTGKGITQSLGKRIKEEDPMGSILAQFHLGVFTQCLSSNLPSGAIARYYLRIAWLYRDKDTFYPEADLDKITASMGKLQERWAKGLPEHKDYPAKPELALSEIDALRLARTYFGRNYEMLREAKVEDELRLRNLLAEVGFRLYELTSDDEDYQIASSFFSGTIQQCISIVSDKSIVGGMVNRAREVLEKAGERGRELRALQKSRGGKGEEVEAPNGDVKTPKKKSNKTAKGENGEAVPPKSKNSSKKEPGSKKKIATPVEAVVVESDGQQRNLDQATRQINLLTEELEELKSRIGEMEEDNKKWRQLAGRDVLTGLPNKTMLFRLVLPKVLGKLEETGPFSCMAISLEQVAQVNQMHGWQMGDRMLKESSKGLRRLASEGEELYRLDGANFVLVGPMSNNDARKRATEMRRRLAGASVQVDQTQFPLVSTLGVVTAERMVGKSMAESANRIYQALLMVLYKAKEKGGNTVEIYSQTKF